LYGICKEDEIIRRLDDKMITLPSVSTDGLKENQSKSAQPVSSEFKINAHENIQIFPNPTTGELQVTSYELQVTGVEIFDIYGRNLSSHTSYLSPHTSINISHLENGIYFVRVTTENGVFTKKILKN